MIDFSPPPHVQATVNDIHRFIEDELKPIERDLADHLANEHLYLRIPGGTDEIQRVNIAKALGL
ncbi:MAG TPA: hypothetical protein VGX03_10540 [Candidatus Binatia bacterium]|jgi:hypothetical protein|nr:hypothetical protein [Candidatus Binatia bacterium]